MNIISLEPVNHKYIQMGKVIGDAFSGGKGKCKSAVLSMRTSSSSILVAPASNHGYSDWATTAIPADVKSMWYRLSRREDDFCIECSTDGKEWSQMRVCHMYEAKDEIRFGIYACSPEDSYFKAVFTNMELTECAWKAHDGQQPDNKVIACNS